jgi:3-deoxy-D-manno-octulosonic-acid transferase
MKTRPFDRLRAALPPLWIYNLCFPIVFLAMLPGFARRMLRRGNYRRKFGQRFGIYATIDRQRIRERFQGAVWVHSISVGETLLALRLIKEMRRLSTGSSPSAPSTGPFDKLRASGSGSSTELRVVLSVTTSTGFALAEENVCEWLEAIYNPIDGWWFARRALELVRPERLIFIEAIWPNLLAQAAGQGIPAALVARLSPRSERRFRRFRFFTGPIFRLLDAVSVQEPEDIQRWVSLGVERERIHVTGNIKFDQPGVRDERVGEFRAVLERLRVPVDAPVLLGGSTFPGEEGMLARIAVRLRHTFPDLFLIVVPRHIERANEAAGEITEEGVSFALRSAVGIFNAKDAKGGASRSTPGCLLVNTTGELRAWYELATVVYIGKSMSKAATGGQNPIEPVFAGKPVLFGPHMENFRAVVAGLVNGDAAIQVADEGTLEQEIAGLLRDQGKRDEMARRALGIVSAHAGATERTARLVLGRQCGI